MECASQALNLALPIDGSGAYGLILTTKPGKTGLFGGVLLKQNFGSGTFGVIATSRVMRSAKRSRESWRTPGDRG